MSPNCPQHKGSIPRPGIPRHHDGVPATSSSALFSCPCASSHTLLVVVLTQPCVLVLLPGMPSLSPVSSRSAIRSLFSVQPLWRPRLSGSLPPSDSIALHLKPNRLQCKCDWTKWAPGPRLGQRAWQVSKAKRMLAERMHGSIRSEWTRGFHSSHHS